MQYDHLGMEVIHVDFARVDLTERVTVTVPLELKGDPKGEAEGGVLTQVVNELEIESLVTDIPSVITHNVSDMALDSVLHLRDVTLPPGAKAMQDQELILATVKEISEEEAGEGESSEPEVIGKATDPAAAAAVPETK